RRAGVVGRRAGRAEAVRRPACEAAMSEDFSLQALFREEVRAHTGALSQGLVALEGSAGDPRAVEPLMRAAHSIKGAARIVNAEPAVRLAHALEAALAGAQPGKARVRAAAVDLRLQATDVLAWWAEVGDGGLPGWAEARATEVGALVGLLEGLGRETKREERETKKEEAREPKRVGGGPGPPPDSLYG